MTEAKALAAAQEGYTTTAASLDTDYVSGPADSSGTRGGGVADDKAAWAAAMTGAEADYAAAAATAGAVETTTDAGAAATMDGALADDESTFEISLAGANALLTSGDGTADEALAHGQAEADAADEVGYAQADADYQDAIWTAYAQQLQSQIPNPQSPTPESVLAQYFASLAGDESAQVAADELLLVAEDGEITQADVTLGDETEAASVDEADAAATDQETETTTLAPEQASAVGDSADFAAQAASEDAYAQAGYQDSAAHALAGFYGDKAKASRDYDNSAAGAHESAADEFATDVATCSVQLVTGGTENLYNDNNAINAEYSAKLVGYNATEISAYGDAEITEATAIGTAQTTLATAEGADEVSLATNESGVANTLAGETATAEETLGGELASQNASDAETVAGDEAATTGIEGGDETATEQQLGSEEVATAAKLAGDQADYAIGMAQAQAAAAASFDQANPGGQADFDSLYAQGYVQWLTDLKPAFVANATTVAQAAAQKEEDLLADETGLADEEADDNADFVNNEAPQAALESDTLAQEADAYQTSTTANVGDDQIGSAKADQTQMNDLATAGAAYILASAQADKDRADNVTNHVADYAELYKKAIADARLTLADGQADADQAWIEGKATADEVFLTADATAWQTMSDGQAETSEPYAVDDDGYIQAENDAVAQNESDALKLEDGADVTQGNSDASAEAAFQIAEANETSSVWSGLAGQLNTPWADSQAGLAAAEAAWAPTAAANYQQYVSALGTAENGYAASDAGQLYTELTDIDLADRTAADETAQADEALTVTLTDDEAAFEQTLAGSGMTYQDEIGQAADGDRKAIAQADHDAIVYGTPADYGPAETARIAAIDLAYEHFADTAGPAMTLQETDDANAELLDAQTVAADGLTDIQDNNAAVDLYSDQESGDFDVQQRADALALFNMQTSDASGHSASIAAFAQSNPSPWADLAAAQAAALANQQTSQAGATQTRSASEADAQMLAEQTETDAQTAEDNADAQAESDQTNTDAQAAHDEAAAQALVTDAVFADLPDTLIAPADGPTPTLTWDSNYGYEANDFSLSTTVGLSPWMEITSSLDFGTSLGLAGALNTVDFMPADLVFTGGTAYDWTGYTTNMFPFGLLGTAGSWTATPEYDDTVLGGGGPVFDNPSVYPIADEVRQPYFPVPTTYQNALHFSDASAEFLNVVNTPGATGVGGYSQSAIPTAEAALELASGAPTTPAAASPVEMLSAAVDTEDPKEPPAKSDRAADKPQGAEAKPKLEQAEKDVEATKKADGADANAPVKTNGKGKTLVVEFLGHKYKWTATVKNSLNGQSTTVDYDIDDGTDGFTALNAAVDERAGAATVNEVIVRFTGKAVMGKEVGPGNLADVQGYITGTLLPAIKGMGSGDTVRVVIVGYSHGSENAIDAVLRVKQAIEEEGKEEGKKLIPEIHLVLLDAINPGTADNGERRGAQPYTSIPDEVRKAAKTVLNYYQRNNLEGNVMGSSLRGKLNRLQQDNILGAQGNLTANVPNHLGVDNWVGDPNHTLTDIDGKRRDLRGPKGKALSLAEIIATWETRGF